MPTTSVRKLFNDTQKRPCGICGLLRVAVAEDVELGEEKYVCLECLPCLIQADYELNRKQTGLGRPQ